MLAPFAFWGCGSHVIVGASAEHDAGANAEHDAGAPPLSVSEAGSGMLSCGGETCSSEDIVPLGLEPPCCFGGSRCGILLTSACVELHAAGTIDPSCPSFAPYQGCCRPNGTCGLVLTNAVLGCVDAYALLPGAAPVACATSAQ